MKRILEYSTPSADSMTRRNQLMLIGSFALPAFSLTLFVTLISGVLSHDLKLIIKIICAGMILPPVVGSIVAGRLVDLEVKPAVYHILSLIFNVLVLLSSGLIGILGLFFY